MEHIDPHDRAEQMAALDWNGAAMQEFLRGVVRAADSTNTPATFLAALDPVHRRILELTVMSSLGAAQALVVAASIFDVALDTLPPGVQPSPRMTAARDHLNSAIKLLVDEAKMAEG